MHRVMVLARGLGDEGMKIETAVYCFSAGFPLLILIKCICNFFPPLVSLLTVRSF